MKLKKIASLMLAGIMAVSMLAGCKSGTPDPENNGGASSNTTSSFTQSVLSKTNDVTKALLTADDNNKLDNAVAYTAQSDTATAATVRGYVTDIKWADATWNSVTLMKQKMIGAENNVRYESNLADVDFTTDTFWSDSYKKPYTMWTVGVISATVSDNDIAEMIANKLDEINFPVDNEKFDYSTEIRVAKSVCKNTKLSDADDDYVIIGVAITCNREAVKY